MKTEDTKYSTEQLAKDMYELKLENRIQTIAVIVLFLFGVSKLSELTKK